MIKQIFETDGIKLSGSCCGRKIRACLDAYGARYDFCRLFSSDSGGYILIYNGSMAADGNFDPEELTGFINMAMPDTIELSSDIALHIDDLYIAAPRTLFEAVSGENNICPTDVKVNDLLDRIFPILEKGFGIDRFDMWYTDISHRIRHGISDIYLYKSTTVTKEYEADDFAFISHIATAPEERGKGTAGNFLRWLSGEFEKQGKKVYLYARDERYSFYAGLGFREISRDVIYERKE